MNKKNKFVIIFAMLLIAVSSLLPALGIKEHKMKINDGYIGIDEQFLGSNDLIVLDGQWQYYDQEFIHSDGLQLKNEGHSVRKITLPAKYQREEKGQLLTKGYGTIALTVDLPKKTSAYGLEVRYIGSAYKVYVDGALLGGVGQIGKNDDEERGLYGPKTLYFQASGETKIEVEFSAFSDTYTFLKSIQLGKKEAIEHYKLGNTGRSFISISLLIFLGFMNLSFYMIRSQLKWTYYFAMFAFLIGIRSISVNQRLLQQLLPNMSWGVSVGFAFMPLFIGLYYYVKFLKARADYALPTSFVQILTRVAIFISVLGVILPNQLVTTYILPVVLVGYGITSGLYFYNVMKHYIATKEDLSLLISILLLLVLFINDMLANFLPMFIPYMSAAGMVLFFLIQATALSYQFGLLLDRAEFVGEQNKALAEELTELNSSLENLVEERTDALRIKKEELEVSNTKLKGLNKHLENLSFIDELTKIPNRRMFFNEIDKGFIKAQRSKGQIILLIIDIDYFKRYNDFYGHVKGDWCLFNIAQAIEDIAEKEGVLAARYGGEEFIMAGFGKTREDAIRIGNKLREAMEEMELKHEDSDVSPHITLSIGGVHSELVSGDAIMTIVDKADNLLYQAKAAGRNKFFI